MHTVDLIFGGSLGSLFSVLGVVGLWQFTDWPHFIWARLSGRKIILIEGIAHPNEGEHWKSWIDVTPITGKLITWRFPRYKIGLITLSEDGKAEYCGGALLWKEIR